MQKLASKLLSWETNVFTVPVILGVAAILGVGLTLLHVIFLNDIFRDVGNCYAIYSRIIAEGDFLQGLNPSLPVMQIALAGMLSRLSGLEPLRALLLTGGMFYLLTMIPLFYLLKRFLPDRAAAWGALAYILAPKVIRFSLTGVPEPARNFFLVTAVLAIFLLFDRATVKKALLLGAALTGFTLSRSEGVIISFMILGTVAGFLFFLNRKAGNGRGLKIAILYPLLAFVCFAALLSPRLYTNWRQTGYPTPDARLDSYLHRYLMPSVPLRDLSGTKIRHTELSTPAKKEKDTALDRFFLQFEQITRGAYEVYLILAVIGLLSGILVAAIRKQLLPEWKPVAEWSAHRPEYIFLVLLLLMHIIIYLPVHAAYRYYIFCVPLLMPLTMAGILFCWELFRRFHLEQFLAVSLVLLAGGQIYNGLDAVLDQNEQHRLAGEWIREKFTPPDRKLRVLNYNGYLFYWTGGEAVNPYYEGPGMLPEYASGFDIAVLDPDDKGRIAILRSRSDLTEIQSPYEDAVTIFQKKEQ